ncbi:acyl-CoA dehydrogenase family protein [Williamsia sp.]|uniref:acyl-CoA dehydrogenase family protein n=1 Tax=Williamsia sp. TaxID=1872085 RepID=UPI002F9535D9
MSTDNLSELHGELRAVARDLLAKADVGVPIDWQLVAGSGWLGLEADDEFDGAGATFAETAVVLREAGQALASGPYPAVATLSLGLLEALAPSAARDELLRDTVSGVVVPIAVVEGESALDELDQPRFRVTRCDAGWQVNGQADLVLGAPVADRLLIPAIDTEEPGGGIVVVVVEPTIGGLEVADEPVVDFTRSFGRVIADDVVVPVESVWRFVSDGGEALRQLHDRAALGVACDSLGLSEAVMAATVEYVGVREQFGRKIGSFQAVKHACADMLVQVTVAQKLVDAAVTALAAGRPDAAVTASMAKSFASSMAVDVAGKAMQLHGGMGYTWESGIHVYLKRAILNRSLYGSPAQHRAGLAARYR